MKPKAIVCLSVSLVLASAAHAQVPPSPYVGEEQRDIKALSPEDVDAYLTGKGMGLAKAAELNGYAGPKHVLELASQLDLTPAQLAKTKTLFESMATKAAALGQLLVSEEHKLDQMFATKSISLERLSTSLTEIGALQAKVRTTHLEAHIAQVDILTPEQNRRYIQLRGYEGGETHSDHGSRHGH